MKTNKLTWYIIGGLLALSLFKSCESCSRGSKLKRQEIIYKDKCDSLAREITLVDSQLATAKDSITALNYRIEALQGQKDLLGESLKHSRQQNVSLTKTIQKVQK